MAVLLFVMIAMIGLAMGAENDRRWLPMTIMGAFLVKLLGSGTRFWVLERVYGGSGDASGYHGAGLELSERWRSFEFPHIERTGTQVVDTITGLLYVPYQPSMLGGFFMFATLAFLGQLLFYAAFRHALPPRHLKTYALFIFFWPTIVYWPSSIGKEAIMTLMLGVASYGVARLLTGYNPLWSLLIGLGLAGSGIVRLHISLLVAGAIMVALVVAKAPDVAAAQVRRVGLIGLAGMALVVVATFTAQDFGVDLSTGVSVEAASENVGQILADVEDQTSTGGSEVIGEGINDISDVPGAILRVLFRPLPHEAANAQLLVASLEGATLLALVLWSSPRIARNILRIRRYPYAVYSAAFTGGFIFAFSSVLNLGILARQRSQVMPFLLALLVVLASRHSDDPEDVPDADPFPGPRELAFADVAASQVGPSASRGA